MRLHPSTAILITLSLGGCDNMPRAFTKADEIKLIIADTSARDAFKRVINLESRVSDIENRLNM